MALSLAALQQPLHSIKVPDPVERMKTLAELRQMQQTGQINDIKIQDAQRSQQEAAAVHQAIMDTNGDFEKALPIIAETAPGAYPHILKMVQDQQQNASEAAKQQFAIQSTQPGKVVPDTSAGNVPDETGYAYKGGGGTQVLPNAPVTFPSVAGQPSYQATPPTTQETDQRKNLAEIMDARIKSEARTAEQRSQAEANLVDIPPIPELNFPGMKGVSKEIADNIITALKPAKQTIEERTVEEWLKAHPGKTLNDYQTMDANRKKTGAATVVIQTSEGPQLLNKGTGVTSPIKTAAGKDVQPAPTAEMRNKQEARGLVSKSINTIKDLGDKIIVRVGPSQRADAIKRGASAVFGNDPDFRTYQDARMALAGNLAVGQQGSRPSDADIKAIWLPLVPDPYRDTRESAAAKWNLINTMSGTEVVDGGNNGPKVGTVENGYIFQGGNPADSKNWKKQ